MDELGDVLATIEGLRVYPFSADRIVPPAAVVAWPDEYNFDAAMTRGADRLTVPVTILAGKIDARSARNTLAAYVNGSAPEPAISLVGVGTAVASADSGALVTLSPDLPADIEADDLLLCLASVRNADTGTVNTPSGWTQLASSNTGNVRVYGKVATGADSPPAVTFASGGTNITALAQCAAVRGASTNLATVVTAHNVQSFGAAQNLPFATLTIPSTSDFGIRVGWKQDDWTSVAYVSNFDRIGEVSSQLGNDAAMLWDYQTGTAGWIGGSYVVTGGAAAQSRGVSFALAAGDPQPNRSVKAVLEAATYSSFDSLRVMSVEFEPITVAGVDYLAGTFNVDIIGTGA